MRRRRLLLSSTAAALVAATGAPGAPAEAAFESQVKRLDSNQRQRMTGVSYRAGCPVGLDELRLVRATHWSFDGLERRGRLIVHRGQARRVSEVLERLHQARFRIKRMHPIDRYGGSDRRSMRRNNTSAFNCRHVAGTTRWSEHAYGRAIDVNPVQNPYVARGHVSPRKGRSYLDRSDRRKGMVTDGVVRAFRRLAGWEWGGNWAGAKDYQHFSRTGR